MVDLGDNKLKSIEGIDEVPQITEFYAAKNRIKGIHPCIGNLKNLKILAIQTNDITKLENLEGLENLEELYMQQNFVKKIEGLDGCPKLTILDLAYNKVTSIDNMD